MKYIKNPLNLWNILLNHSCKNPHFITLNKDLTYFKCSNCLEEYICFYEDIEKYKLIMDKELKINYFITNYFLDPKKRLYLIKKLQHHFKTK